MTRQEEFDFAAKEAEKISAKIYKLYCGTNDEEELTEKELIKHNIRINIILKWIQDLIYENQGFLYNY